MPRWIARIFEPLLRLLWPPAGRHRRLDRRCSGLAPEASRLGRTPAAPALRGEDIGLVRPYLVAHERRTAERRRVRRRGLRLAVHGIDLRLLPGAEVRAW
ncbi:hypothetical protein ACGFNV_29485 [Streptomyces sp. NPDC048751]|uniref:hypothetical protein n=1 Tax=Streptomyces sp. NPDC048751 TaxID=3365591 RepID=UPI00371D2A64